jgi:hypothetical protein
VTALILALAAGTLGLVSALGTGVVIAGVFFSADRINKIAAIIAFGSGVAGAEAFFSC